MNNDLLNLSFWQNTLNFGLIYGLFGLAVYVNLAAGLLSFATVSVGALTGFMAAAMAEGSGMPLLLLLPLGGVVGLVASAAVFQGLRRLESHYLAMATLALVLVTRVIILNGPSSVTGGVQGRTVELIVETWHLLVVVAVFALMLIRLRGSALWLSFDSVRADPEVAAGMGINQVKVQRISFCFSGVIAGVAGVLLAGTLQYIGPTSYDLPLAFVALSAAVLGGAYHWAGPFIGGLVLTALPALLSNYTTHGVQLINGLAILVIVIFLPHGIVNERLLNWGHRAGLR